MVVIIYKVVFYSISYFDPFHAVCVIILCADINSVERSALPPTFPTTPNFLQNCHFQAFPGQFLPDIVLCIVGNARKEMSSMD